MRLEDDELWASGIDNVAPAVARIAGGFQCGDADPALFNWLFYRLSQALITLQNEVTTNEDIVDDFIDAQGDINEELDSRTQTATASTEGIARTAQLIDWIAPNPRTDRMVTPFGLQERDEQLGAYWQRFNNSNDRWDLLLSGGDTPLWSMELDHAQQVKGVYLVAVNLPAGFFDPNTTQMGCEFEVTFKRRNNTPDNLYIEKRLRVSSTNNYVRVYFQAFNLDDGSEGNNFKPRIEVGIRLDDDTIAPELQVAQIQKMVMPLSLTEDFTR